LVFDAFHHLVGADQDEADDKEDDEDEDQVSYVLFLHECGLLFGGIKLGAGVAEDQGMVVDKSFSVRGQ